MRICIYCRVDSAHETEAMGAQDFGCRTFLDTLLGQAQWRKRFQSQIGGSGKLLPEVIFEHVPGTVPFAARPRGSELLAKLDPGDHLCVLNLDCAFKSAGDCYHTLVTLRDRGVSVSVCDLPGGADVTGDSGVDTCLLSVLSLVCEWDHARSRQRAIEHKRVAKEAGRYLGGAVPWEMKRVGQRIVSDPHKLSIIRTLREWRSTGVPLRACQERLANDHQTTISLKIIKRLTDDVRNAAARKRGRRRRE
jgi:DNA invertase Pin-like site-specific DNA recombinase